MIYPFCGDISFRTNTTSILKTCTYNTSHELCPQYTPCCCLVLVLGGRFKNVYEFLKLRPLQSSFINKLQIFQCMGKIFCVIFQRYPLKFHTKYLTHTLKDTILFDVENSRAPRFMSLYAFLKRPPSWFYRYPSGLLHWHGLIYWDQLIGPGKCGYNLKSVIFNLIRIDILSISSEIALRWMPQDLTDEKSTLAQVKAWCRQATSHYHSQCWPRSMSPNGVSMSQWVDVFDLQRPCMTPTPSSSWHNSNNKSKHIKTMCIFHGIYCKNEK